MTHRTELPRPLALTPRSGAAPAPQPGEGFAALLDAETSRPADPAARPSATAAAAISALVPAGRRVASTSSLRFGVIMVAPR